MGVLNRFRLPGQVVLVTGAATPVGRAVSMAVAEAGADVALVDRDGDVLDDSVALLRRETNARVLSLDRDVTDVTAAEAAVGETVAEFGGLDVAFACAAPGGEDRRGALLAVATTARAAAAAMEPGGRVVNVGPVPTGRERAASGPRASADGGEDLPTLTRELAAEFAPREIRINAISTGEPGPQPGEPVTVAAGAGGTDEDAQGARVTGLAGLKGPALFLASEASSYTNGEVLPADGGPG